jgi:membrane associated rhomboid family serine protease
MHTPTVGASGAIYGLLGAVAYLFPNTTVYLYFAIPIKMKWLALILGGFALLMGIQNNAGDSVAHFAHLGGMLVGLLLVKIWQKDTSHFY